MLRADEMGTWSVDVRGMRADLSLDFPQFSGHRSRLMTRTVQIPRG
jgi:hypothetical protein